MSVAVEPPSATRTEAMTKEGSAEARLAQRSRSVVSARQYLQAASAVGESRGEMLLELARACDAVRDLERRGNSTEDDIGVSTKRRFRPSFRRWLHRPRAVTFSQCDGMASASSRRSGSAGAAGTSPGCRPCRRASWRGARRRRCAFASRHPCPAAGRARNGMKPPGCLCSGAWSTHVERAS